MISVSFPSSALEAIGHEILCGIHILVELRKAGVPVIGRVWPTGVERGRLTTYTDQLFGDHIYEWSEE